MTDDVATALTALVAAIREQVLAEVAAATPKPSPAPDQGDGPLLLTLREAAKTLRVSKATLDRLMAQGRLGRVKIGSRSFVPAEEISRFITEASAD
ncbi:DNA-binding protein, excisionase family [Mycobacteroides abscessus subsp. abscessus]|uniref:helix-turn-helix domain-containing protein n=1 Tax=Mycobacteroides abscessus TaxID=36809 RepID=UPI0009276694|nr:helix-turn-helix domain-containing protein [Mycobacteroides abscessus]SHX68788.1 DNA-binding protein, excisionase family [Mycobacteroides abscessus subsp. abscessus]SIC57585.1 DNA-binding protein, excisionase family [Mycobacteroides abscessus subsp. abscessus]SKK19320.1 DNA-binding protein, excisionase family [Mycobacteroides abscessus subsp. abscessus]SKP48711.1 DNA-binding protein, excisionase family [Mycobacteroides abscessus subsp. abscessus]